MINLKKILSEKVLVFNSLKNEEICFDNFKNYLIKHKNDYNFIKKIPDYIFFEDNNEFFSGLPYKIKSEKIESGILINESDLVKADIEDLGSCFKNYNLKSDLEILGKLFQNFYLYGIENYQNHYKDIPNELLMRFYNEQRGIEIYNNWTRKRKKE